MHGAKIYIFFNEFRKSFPFYYKKAEFDAVGVGAVYQLASFEDGALKPRGNPFLALANGGVKYYDPSEITFRQTLTRKSPESNRWEEVEKQIPSLYFPGNTAEKLFDGDVLTFFHTSDSLAWGAVELPEPSAVSKIRFKIRNDEVVWR